MTQPASTHSQSGSTFFKDFENFLKQTALLFISPERLTSTEADTPSVEREIHELILPFHDAFWILAQSYAHQLGGMNLAQARLIQQLESLLPLNNPNDVDTILNMAKNKSPDAWRKVVALTHQCAEMIQEMAPQNPALAQQMIQLVNQWLAMVISNSDASDAAKKTKQDEYQSIYVV